jgi:hypothetical protein
MIRHTGIRLVGDLHEVQIELTGHGQGFGQRLDTDLGTIGATRRTSRADAVVDPGLVGCWRGYRQSLLINAQALPSRADRR